MRLGTVLAAATAVLVTAGCAGQQPDAATDLKPVLSIETARIPPVITDKPDPAQRALLGAGLVPILRYEAGVVGQHGTVIATLPVEGTEVELGSVVTVVIAGPPAKGLGGLVDAHRETYLGVAKDASGTWVVAVHDKADITSVMAQIDQAADGRRVRVQRCEHSWAELTRIQVELGRQDFVAGVDDATLGLSVDPLACAVRLGVNLTVDQLAEVADRYGKAVIIDRDVTSRTNK